MIRFVLIILFVLLSCFASSQTVLSLEECIRIAQENSIEARQAKNNYLIANHDYTLYRKSLLPAVTLSGNLPAFNHAISTITMPDGSESFVTQSVGKYSGALSINQIIPFTGGQFYVSSGLQRLDIYQDNTTTSYLANVINLGLSQSILSYNPYKWKKKIEPIQYEKAKRIYIEKLEETALLAINHYFELLSYQFSKELLSQNKLNSDTLLSMAKERFNLEKITEDELLEVEINNLNLIIQIEEMENNRLEKQSAIIDFLGLTKGETLHLQVPNELLLDAIEQSKVEFEAKQNGSAELYYQQNLLEAQSELAQSKSDHGFAVNLYASFGLSQSDELFRNAYINPLNQEQITLSFTIPVIDWGVAKQKRKRAEVVFHNTTLSIKQDELDFYRNLNNIVRQFNLHNSYLKLVKKTGELSSIRFEMSKERYIVGKIGFLDYSVAQNERNNAQLNYIKTLKKSWVKYYEIRKLTLYDFIEDKKIDVELRK